MKVLLFLTNYHPILTEVSVKLLKMKFEKKRRKGKGRKESLMMMSLNNRSMHCLQNKKFGFKKGKTRIRVMCFGAGSVAKGHHYPH